MLSAAALRKRLGASAQQVTLAHYERALHLVAPMRDAIQAYDNSLAVRFDLQTVAVIHRGDAHRHACSCDARGYWCEHLVALYLLDADLTDEERADKRVIGPLLGADIDTWRAWSEPLGMQVDVEQMLESHTYVAHRYLLRFLKNVALDISGPNDKMVVLNCWEAVESLHRLAYERVRLMVWRREASWRQEEPDDPRLSALWARLHRLAEAYGDCEPMLEPNHTNLRYRAEGGPDGAITFFIGRYRVPLLLATTTPDEGNHGDPSATMAAIEACLDAIGQPERFGRLYQTLSEISFIEPWERAFALLEEEVYRLTQPTDVVAWVLTEPEPGALALQPYWLKLGARGGIKLRKWKGELDGVPTDERDRLTMWSVLARTHAVHHGVHPVIERLIDHPNLYTTGNKPIRIARSPLRMRVRPTGDQLQVQWTLDEKALSHGDVLKIASRGGTTHSYQWDGGPVFRLISAPIGGFTLVKRLAALPELMPRSITEPLLAQLTPLMKHSPIVLEGDLAGQPLAPDETLHVRLTVDKELGLTATANLRPLAEDALYAPGDGPEQLNCLRDGVRYVVNRDLLGEEERAYNRLAALGWQGGFHHVTTSIDEAVELVDRLSNAGPDVVVSWDRKPWVVTRPTKTRVKARGLLHDHLMQIDGTLSADTLNIPIARVLEAIRDGRRWVQVKDGTFVEIAKTVRKRLHTLAHATWGDADKALTSPLAATALADLADDHTEIELAATLRARVDQIREANALRPALPDGFQATLRPYQREGFDFLARLSHWAPGGVLADEMGLGKTIQALALLLHRAPNGPALVVAPASMVDTWQLEAQRFAPDLRLRVSRGAGREAQLVGLGPFDVLVMSWDVMVRDQAALGAIPFTTLVLDEAHAIKNPATRRSQAVRRLNADFSLALTGTPVENRLDELWALLSRIVPGLLGTLARFRDVFGTPIEDDADVERRLSLSQVVRPFLLRRRKREVAVDLPERTEHVEHITLTAREMAWYDTTRLALIESLGARTDGDGPSTRLHALAGLTRLRQLACHPKLVHEDAPALSSKLSRLRELVAEIIGSDAQVLVFSQFTSLLDLAEPILRGDGARVVRLDGSTPQAERQARVSTFQAGAADVFLLSLKAGGVGLTLTAASYVILLDPWWNPAVEAQAADRAHRIGQHKAVNIIRLISKGTVEEAVTALQAEKRALVEGLLDEAAPSAALDPAELLALISGAGLSGRDAVEASR